MAEESGKIPMRVARQIVETNGETWDHVLPAVPLSEVTSVVLDREQGAFSITLSCGHEITFHVAAGPVLAVMDTLGLPQLGDRVTCSTCQTKALPLVPIIYGSISDT